MLKKTITYTNPFTQQPVSEEHYFHISKSQLIDLQMEYQNEPAVKDPITGNMLEGYPARMQKVINEQDGSGLVELLKDFIRLAYGRKDGDRFIRSKAITAEFESTEAFSQLYFEICTDADIQNEFINSILPGELQEEVNQIVAKQAADAEKAKPEAEIKAPSAEQRAQEELENSHDDEAAQRLPRILTQAEMEEMDGKELQSGLVSGRYKLA